MLALDNVIKASEFGVDSDPSIKHAALMARVANASDKQAFSDLFAFFAPKVKGLMLKQNVDPELAEELMQETMLTVWTKAGQFTKGRGSVSAWIFTIARNKRIDRFRKQGIRHYVDVDEFEFPDDSQDSEDQLLASERDRLVASATEKLPEEQKQVVKMSFIDDLPQIEIANQLGIPLGTVKSRMRLAYNKIKTELEGVI